MGMQGGTAGLAGLMDYRFIAGPGGQAKFSGPDSRGFPLAYQPLFLWVIVGGAWIEPEGFTATDGSSVTLSAAVNAGTDVRFISLPPFNVADTYSKAGADAAFTRRRNRFTDPGMRVSQENGNNAGSGASFYPSDGIYAFHSTAAGSRSVQRVNVPTPGGSPWRVRYTVTGANAAPAAGDQSWLNARIEGLDIADLRFGTASARNIAVRIGCRAPAAGLYSLAVLNGALNRSWVGTFAITAAEVGLDVVKHVPVTGDQGGAWTSDNSLGMSVYVGMCLGSNLTGVAGWQNAGMLSVPGTVNVMATNGNTFDLFDVALWDVQGMASGVYPPFELGAFVDDFLKCQRYYNKTYDYDVLPGSTGQVSGSYFIAVSGQCTYDYVAWSLPVEMRVSPTATLYNPNSGAVGTAYSYASGNSYTATAQSGRRNIKMYGNGAAGGNNYAFHCVANARM